MEPHAPYQPPEPFVRRFAKSGSGLPDIATANRKLVRFPLSQITTAEAELLESYYDAEVAAVDDELRKLFAELRRRHFLDHAVVVITADHGEEFKDHDWMSHGTALYEETVHVPLLLSAPGIEAGRIVDENVTLVDVAPTVLDLCGMAAEPRFEGRSLTPLLRNSTSSDREPPPKDGPPPPILLQLLRTDTSIDFRRHTAGVIEGRSKLLLSDTYDRTELFDLSSDPHERSPQQEAQEAAAKRLVRTLRERETALGKRMVSAGEEAQIDESTKEKLRALGYGDLK